jgi:Polo-like Kinase 4 Polo Box 1
MKIYNVCYLFRSADVAEIRGCSANLPSSELIRSSSSIALPPILNTSRLQAVRHRTKNVVLSILDSGEVALEFVKREKVVEVCRISSDGSRVGAFERI